MLPKLLGGPYSLCQAPSELRTQLYMCPPTTSCTSLPEVPDFGWCVPAAKDWLSPGGPYARCDPHWTGTSFLGYACPSQYPCQLSNDFEDAKQGHMYCQPLGP